MRLVAPSFNPVVGGVDSDGVATVADLLSIVGDTWADAAVAMGDDPSPSAANPTVVGGVRAAEAIDASDLMVCSGPPTKAVGIGLIPDTEVLECPSAPEFREPPDASGSLLLDSSVAVVSGTDPPRE